MIIVKPKLHFSLDKTIEPDLTLDPSYIIDNSKRKLARKRWRVLVCVIRSVHILRNRQAYVIQDLDTLIREVESSPTLPRYTKQRTISYMQEAIDDHKLTDKLFYHITRSTKEDMVRIERIIEDHPSRYTRPKGDSHSMANKKNWLGIRPIYEAARNGHLEVTLI